MKIALRNEIRQIDQYAAEEYGLKTAVLMENAGREVCRALLSLLNGLAGKNVCLLAGSGNNGGDTFAAARHIANCGAKVKIFFLGNEAHLSEASAANKNICHKMGLDIYSLANEREWDKLQVALRLADGIVDGILGTGAAGALRDNVRRAVQLINEAGKMVLAVDMPTGADAQTGQIDSVAVKANLTVTFGIPKTGQFFSPGADCVGELLVDDIGLPAALLQSEEIKQQLISESLAAEMILPRRRDAHKGLCGKVLIAAGSPGFTGAAALAAEAVLKAGAGVAVLAVAKSLQPVMAAKLTEVMTRALPEKEAGVLGEDSLAPLLTMAHDFDVVLLGPGLGRNPHTLDMVRTFVQETETPVILDADAIYAFAAHHEDLAKAQHRPVLTPHLGELAHLLGIDVRDIRKDIVLHARRAAQKLQAVLVVKSECTIIAYPEGNVYVTTTGNAAMATAGSGDVLAGTIAGLCKQTVSGMAPAAGVYLHGLAGDLAAKELGNGLLAGDILAFLPAAGKKLAAKDI